MTGPRGSSPRGRRSTFTLASFTVAASTGALLLAAPQAPQAPQVAPPTPPAAPSVAETIRPPAPVSSPLGVVVSATSEASWAGARILEAGGNAVDAAVAAAFALGASDPGGSGLGGQTWMVIRLASGVERAVLCPSRVPARIDRARIRAARRGTDLWGPMAAAVPTTVATLDHALRHYGTLPLADVLAPAVEAAEGGYAIHSYERPYLGDYKHRLWDSEALLPVFLTGPIGESGYPEPAPVGACVRLPALAGTLRRLSEAGAKDFYTGRIAATLDAEVRAAGGFVSKADLARVPASVLDVAPARGVYRGRTALSVPAPAGGSAFVMALQILDALPPETLAAPGLVRGHAIVEAVRLARAGAGLAKARGEVTEGPVLSEWLTPRWAAGQAARIRPGRAIPQEELLKGGSAFAPDRGTSQVSVVDAAGNAVSLTQTLGRYYGAGWAAPSLGFPLNAFVETLDSDDRDSPAFLGPGAAAFVAVAPFVLVRDGQVVLVAGTAGSSRIPSILLNVLVALVDGGDGREEAYARPRLIWEDDSAGPRVMVELAPPFGPESVAALKEMGYRKVFALAAPGRDTAVFGGVHAVLRDAATGEWVGCVDGRREATAAAPTRLVRRPR
ncbi:MAG: gamma-glutamyltransferase [Thermoanaerobaculia bacterium]